MAITFNEIPANLRVPGVRVEVDPSGAVRGLAGYPVKVLVLGQKLSTGSATAAVPVQVFDAAQAVGLFGQHSQLTRMFEALKRADPWTPTYAIPLADLTGGVQATGTITIGGTPTQAGTLSLMIGGRRIRVAVAAAEAVATTATAIAAAITAAETMPVTATAALGVVTLTARHKGENGNTIDVRANYWAGEATPPGMTVAIAAMSGGTGNPDIAGAIAAMSAEWWTDVITPWTDSANMTALETELSTRWQAMTDLPCHAWTALSATLANAITWANSRNSQFVSTLAFKASPTPAEEWAAAYGILCARDLGADPARPMTDVALPGILAPAIADRFTATERNSALFDGLATWVADAAGTVTLERVTTNYQLNASGAADPAWLDVTTPKTAARIRYELKIYVARNHSRHKIADDGTRFAAGQNVSTPSSIKGTVAACYMALEQAGLLENVTTALEGTLVERDAAEPTRVNILTPPDLVNPLYIIAIKLQFRL
jgi:phage tail sheath gpL-like